jgi:cytochrome c biogenesis protein CcdA
MRPDTMIWPVLFFGFLLGMEHALEADHVAAVAALATRATSVRGTMKTASLWGAGHALTLFAFGAVLIVIGASLPERVDRAFEFAVGAMLVVVGADVLRRLRRKRFHVHAHQHDGVRHLHVHSHEADLGHEHRHSPPPMLVGSIHGLAGSAALILLSLQTMRSGAEALLYLAVFGLGTMAGMVLFALLVFAPIKVSSRHLGWASLGLEGAVGVITIALGGWIAASVARF